MKPIRTLFVLLGFMLATPASAADTESHYHRVSYQVQVEASVANDRMAVTLAAEANEAAPKDVANKINGAMQWALQRAKASQGVEVKTGNYSVNPVYQKDRPQRWRGYQELHLEGSDYTQLSELMAQLQEKLQVKSSSFFVATDTRKAIEQELVDQAAQQFQQRADQLVKSFNAKQYVLVSASLNTSGYSPRADMKMGRVMMAEAAAPAFEGGESDVVVSIDGTIELVP